VSNEVDRRLNIVSTGKMAEIAWQHFGEDLEAQRDAVLQTLKNQHRLGKNDLGALAGGVAALCALDDLKERILKKVKRSIELNKETLNGPSK
jgi:hypothetical protein